MKWCHGNLLRCMLLVHITGCQWILDNEARRPAPDAVPSPVNDASMKIGGTP